MIIEVKVSPGRKKEEIEKFGEVYKVSLKEKAEDNKANLALLKLLKKHFKGEVRIVKGLKSRKKIVEVK